MKIDDSYIIHTYIIYIRYILPTMISKNEFHFFGISNENLKFNTFFYYEILVDL